MLAMRAGASSAVVATPSDAEGGSGAAVGAAVVPPAVPSPAQRTRHAAGASQPVGRAGTAKASPLTRTQLRDTLIGLLQVHAYTRPRCRAHNPPCPDTSGCS